MTIAHRPCFDCGTCITMLINVDYIYIYLCIYIYIIHDIPSHPCTLSARLTFSTGFLKVEKNDGELRRKKHDSFVHPHSIPFHPISSY